MIATMKKKLTITMNPAIDVSTDVEQVVPERKLRCNQSRREAGGGGINVARVLSRLGLDTAALFPAGGNIGDLLTRLVTEEGLESIMVPIRGETRENFTATESVSGEQYRFVLAGPDLEMKDWEKCLDTIACKVAEVDLVVASGSLSPGVPANFFSSVAQITAKHNVRFILDTAGAALEGALGPGISLVKPNLRELRDLVGESLANEKAQIEACKTLVNAGQAEAIALTLGSEGAILVSTECIWRARPPKITVNSIVGAGDSFTAGMAWAMSTGWSIEKAFTFGIAAGTAAALTPGTELCHKEDIWRLLDQVELEQISA